MADESPGRRRSRASARLGVEAVEQGSTFDPLTGPAEGDLYEAMNVRLLRIDLVAEFGKHTVPR